MKRMSFDEVMSSKEYTLVMDGTAPIGAATYRHNVTGEVVLVVMNEEVFNMAQNTVNTQATNNTANNMEGNTMMNEAMNNATNNNAQEEKKMTFKERWMKNLKKGQDLGYEAAHKTGYGIGYATTTVKEEVSYAARKVAKAVSETRVAQEVRDGYYEGKNDAMTAFDCRVAEREFKAEQKKNAKTNLDAAVDELMDEFEDFDDSVCGDGIWNAQ